MVSLLYVSVVSYS
ncbi:hypothetical protein CGLO_14806 [Colletotrichum gloeosporioides Cg-14]|uniref:Uncharacterized protein n=1 Tax=Colletotrichum gloeosporioides (strain Cg-14) TaxID=1237896 RepID=T0K345_COLGC|nr:hypothetical protein CGLO_14806 [Colletotrichum gloeosporioides Cg-14]